MPQVAEVRFSSYHTQNYHYLTDIEGLEAGDKAVVDAPSSGLTIVDVVSVHDGSKFGKATKWIVDKVDLNGYKQRQEKEAKRKSLKEQMEKMRKELDEDFLLKMYAENNPQFAEVYNEYKTLN